jgi:hypothetical protein
MTSLAESVDRYLALRRGLGFKLGRPGQLITQFASYCAATGSDLMTTELALTWARQPAAARPLWWALPPQCGALLRPLPARARPPA